MDLSKILLAAVTAVGIASSPSLAAGNLSPDDIKANFGAGASLSAATVPGGTTFSMTLNPDGTAQMAKGKGSKTGNWRVSDTGYCSKWGTNRENCFTVKQNGGGYDVMGASGQVVAHWTR